MMREKNIEQNFWQKTKRFFEPALDNKKVSLELFIHFFINAFSGVIFVLFIKRITEALELGDVSSFNSTLIYFGFLYLIFQFIYFLVYKLGWTAAYNSYQKSIQNKYIPHYINFDNNYYEKIGTGKSIAIISKGLKTWSELLDHLIHELTRLFVVLGLSVYLISLIDSRLLIFLFLLLLLGQGFGLYMNSFMVAIRKKRILIDNLLGKHLVTIIMSKMEILQSSKIQLELKRLNEYNDKEIYYNIKMAPYLISFFSISHFIIFIILFTTFYLFGNLYFKGEVSLGLIAGLSSSILLMQKIFLDSLDFLKNFAKKFAEVQNLWDFFDDAPQIEGYEEGKIFKHKSGKISLKNVSYGYDTSKPVFQGFSLDIPGNQVTAFVGPSGGGKSTLVKLISGYIRQNDGNILVDGQNLRDVSLKSYFADVGYLTQEPSVFDGTVRENLLYAVTPSTQPSPLEEKERATNKQKNAASFSSKGERIQEGGDLKKVIKFAHCDFIYDLPDGLDTEIGERGVRLSGGQKQRLAIAKIFFKNPKIIILDEPTSALDSLSEQKITEAMHNLFKNRTVIVIAHRLQTVKYADDIIVIEDGKVRERGTHSELVKKKGFYKQMLDLQSGF